MDRFALKDPRMSVLARNNGHLAGDGLRAMVFVHGFDCDQNMWRFVEPEFRSGFRTVILDHVGAGKSDLSAYATAKYAALYGYADALVEIGRELKLKNAVFVGHSVSAMIGLLADQGSRALRVSGHGRSLASLHRRRRLHRRFQRDGDRRVAAVSGGQSHGLVCRHGAGNHGQSQPS